MPVLHGLRHNQKFEGFIVDTKLDNKFVLLFLDGKEVIRQAKYSAGRVFRQGSNPDYKGRETYPIWYFNNGVWHEYDHQAHQGDVRYQIKRLKEAICQNCPS